MHENDEKICVAELKSAYGIKGWLWLYSFTDPMTALFDYEPLFYYENGKMMNINIEKWRKQGKGLVVKLANVDDRTIAESFTNSKIWLKKTDLPQLTDDEFYWSQLVGLTVVNDQGSNFGIVKQLFETNAHQIMEVQATQDSIDLEKRLIPWHDSIILNVDLIKGQVVVDWQQDY